MTDRQPPRPLHVLLTNDDGILAPGLSALERAVRQVPGVTVSVVAPATEQSMCGHRVTTHRIISVEQRGDHRWAVDGTPADCVRIALYALGLRPDWVLSGVNAGGNLGQDVVISGTCAAAREAAYHQVQAAAFSHYLVRDVAVDWERVSQWTLTLFDTLRRQTLADGEFWSVNYPHHPPGPRLMPAVRECQPARSPLNVAFESREEGGYHYTASYAERPRDPGSDVEVCFGGDISLSRLRL